MLVNVEYSVMDRCLLETISVPTFFQVGIIRVACYDLVSSTKLKFSHTSKRSKIHVQRKAYRKCCHKHMKNLIMQLFFISSRFKGPWYHIDIPLSDCLKTSGNPYRRDHGDMMVRCPDSWQFHLSFDFQVMLSIYQ